MDFRFFQCFLEVLQDPIAVLLAVVVGHRINRPRTDECLINQILFIRIGHDVAVDFGEVGFVQILPALESHLPFVGRFRQHVQAGSHVLAALGVVRRTGVHRVWPFGGPVLHQAVKFIDS